ncbi:MAG: DNA sulfur modification protein DndB [Candidatus Bathyarchaeia archaeon]|jgi:DNA sulfur modification protein DndB
MTEGQINDLLGGIDGCESNNYTFMALRGIQAGREYYTVMCQLSVIPRLFMFDEKQLPPTQRAQRQLNRSRIPAISRYILDDPKNYVFSSITASIDGRVEFVPFSKNGAASKVGHLIIPQSAKFLINDGQHRRAAIEEALNKMPELGSEHISVVFFVDGGLKRSQQMFSDLNKHALRPTMSLAILYNHRENLARLTKRISDSVPVFINKIELEKSSLSNRSLKLFTLSSLYQATKYLLGTNQKVSRITEKSESMAVQYWTEVSKNMLNWQLVQEGKATACDLRKNYVDVHGIVLQALGIAGRTLLDEHWGDWRDRLSVLQGIDWSRSNKLWQGCIINSGRVTASTKNVALVSILIKKALGLALGKAEEDLEKDRQQEIRAD